MGFIKKRRHLELAVLKVEHGEVSFRIVKQTHFGDSFTGKKIISEHFFRKQWNRIDIRNFYP